MALPFSEMLYFFAGLSLFFEITEVKVPNLLESFTVIFLPLQLWEWSCNYTWWTKIIPVL